MEREDVLDAVYGEQRIVKDPAHRNGLGYQFYHFSNAQFCNAAERLGSDWLPEDLKVFEDLGIAKRILDRAGRLCMSPKSAVFHSHSHTTGGLIQALLRHWLHPEALEDLGRSRDEKIDAPGCLEVIEKQGQTRWQG